MAKLPLDIGSAGSQGTMQRSGFSWVPDSVHASLMSSCVMDALENRLGIHVAVLPQHPQGMLPKVLLKHLFPPVVWMRTYIIKII
jgi:hypothetical protein